MILRTREVAAFNRLADAVLQPPAPLPPAAATSAARSLAATLAATAPENRVAIHALVRAAALLGPDRLLPALRRGALADLVRTLAAQAYYADDDVQRLLGHEPGVRR